MQWPNRVQDILDALAAKFPELTNRSNDESRREFTMRFAQQCRFELGPSWGTKRAAQDRPLSADVICQQTINGAFVGWDWSVPTGIARFPESMDLIGQIFVPVVPFDFLGEVPSQLFSTPPQIDLGPLIELTGKLVDVEQSLALLASTIRRLEGELILLREIVNTPKPAPSYSGKVLGFSVVLKPI